MAQARRHVHDIRHYRYIGLDYRKPIRRHRRLADLAASHCISDFGHDLDRASAAIIAVDGNRKMARVTGLEPATSGVTGRRSNQLSYTRLMR